MKRAIYVIGLLAFHAGMFLLTAALDEIFDYTFQHIGPFYSNDSIIAQSRYDVNETSYDLFVTNLAAKRQMLKERRNWILQELDIQQKR